MRSVSLGARRGEGAHEKRLPFSSLVLCGRRGRVGMVQAFPLPTRGIPIMVITVSWASRCGLLAMVWMSPAGNRILCSTTVIAIAVVIIIRRRGGFLKRKRNRWSTLAGGGVGGLFTGRGGDIKGKGGWRRGVTKHIRGSVVVLSLFRFLYLLYHTVPPFHHCMTAVWEKGIGNRQRLLLAVSTVVVKRFPSSSIRWHCHAS